MQVEFYVVVLIYGRKHTIQMVNYFMVPLRFLL
jgi:hypothetical protein